MKHLRNFVVVTVLFFQSCITIEPPFDKTLLENNYWTVFAQSLKQVAFDHPAYAAYGFYRNTEQHNFTYSSDLVDPSNHQRMYFIHERTDNQIVSSYYDSTHFSTEDERNKIEWDIDDKGMILGGMKYDTNYKLISSEKFKMEFDSTALATIYERQSTDGICKITEKQKFNSRGELIETLKYTYFDDDTYEITSIKPSGESTKLN